MKSGRKRISLKRLSINIGFRKSRIFLLNQIYTSLPYFGISLEMATQSGEKFRHKNRQLII